MGDGRDRRGVRWLCVCGVTYMCIYRLGRQTDRQGRVPGLGTYTEFVLRFLGFFFVAVFWGLWMKGSGGLDTGCWYDE
jgi:hypothetical protein